MKYDQAFFDAGIRRLGTDCVKWDDPEHSVPNAVPLWVADMDFPCAEEITQALSARAQHPCYGYTMSGAADDGAFCDFALRRHGLSVTPEDLAMLPCVITGLKTLVRECTKPGDPVAILTPVYGQFTSSIESNGRTALRVPLLRDQDLRYQIDFDALEQAFRGGVRLFLMCSPHNPVSRNWSRDELARVLDLCRRYGVVLGVDEIHAEFVFPPHAFVSILALAGPEDRAVSLMSASKTFNIAGLQQAVMISRHHGLLKELSAALEAGGAVSGNLFALCGTRAAYQYGDAWLDGLLAYLRNNIKILETETAQRLPLARLTPVEATYLAWLDLRAYSACCEELTNKLSAQGVFLTSGTFFGPEGEGFMRLNFGCPSSQLREGLRRMALALA